MSDTPSTAAQPPVDTRLATRVAEMLAMPHLVCGRRDCRRDNACEHYYPDTGLPACVRDLFEEERPVFDALYADALLVREHWRGLDLMPADAEQRELRDAAFAVVRADLPRKDWRAFARRLRVRQAHALPAGSFDAYDREAFELFLRERRQT